MKYLIERDRRFWNTCGWSPYRHSARRFSTKAEAEHVAKQMTGRGIACAIVPDMPKRGSYQDRKIDEGK
jgi:hypothetical protein